MTAANIFHDCTRRICALVRLGLPSAAHSSMYLRPPSNSNTSIFGRTVESCPSLTCQLGRGHERVQARGRCRASRLAPSSARAQTTAGDNCRKLRGGLVLQSAAPAGPSPLVYRGVSSSPVHRTFVPGCEGPSIAVLRSVLVVYRVISYLGRTFFGLICPLKHTKEINLT
eukprot:scaffold581_cov83-Phaeocystis_antarctica.AAC.11